MPQDLSRSRLERHEISLRVAAEHQSARGRKHAGPRRRWMLPLPFHLTASWIQSPQRAPERRRVIVREIRAAIIGVTFFERLRRSAKDVALFARRHIEQFRLR